MRSVTSSRGTTSSTGRTPLSCSCTGRRRRSSEAARRCTSSPTPCRRRGACRRSRCSRSCTDPSRSCSPHRSRRAPHRERHAASKAASPRFRSTRSTRSTRSSMSSGATRRRSLRPSSTQRHREQPPHVRSSSSLDLLCSPRERHEIRAARATKRSLRCQSFQPRRRRRRDSHRCLDNPIATRRAPQVESDVAARLRTNAAGFANQSRVLPISPQHVSRPSGWKPRRIDETPRGRALVRITRNGEGYRVSDFAETLMELDAVERASP